jgi:uncharacterized protein GlcG (DUF336 family)
MSQITLALSKKLIEAAEKEATKIKVPMVISIVDPGGNLVACHRMDEALLVSVDIAQNKAWTSIAMKMPTEILAQATGSGKELFGINTTNNGRVVIFGGGIPLLENNQIIGAVGVSGGSVKEDIQVAKAAVDMLGNSSKTADISD